MKNQIKYLQRLFYDILNDYGKVYIAVRHSENTVIGARGFTDEEKKNGIILVFTQKNCRDLIWSDDGSIRGTLGFGAGNRPEKCFIHADDVVSVFSPEAKIKLDRWDMLEQADGGLKSKNVPGAGAETTRDKKVVSLERFRKSRNN